MTGIRAGRLRDRVTIQSVTTGSDEYGGTTETWADGKSRRCDITSLKGAEFIRAGAEQVQNTFEIRFRYESGLINTAQRLIDKRVSPNRIFDVKSAIDEYNDGRILLVTAVERQWPTRV